MLPRTIMQITLVNGQSQLASTIISEIINKRNQSGDRGWSLDL